MKLEVMSKELRDLSGITRDEANMQRRRRWIKERARAKETLLTDRDRKRIIRECRHALKRLSID